MHVEYIKVTRLKILMEQWQIPLFLDQTGAEKKFWGRPPTPPPPSYGLDDALKKGKGKTGLE